MSNWGTQPSEGGKAGSQGGANTTSSGISGPSFDSMYEQKRATDPQSVAKRESIADQKPKGMIGKAMESLVSGPGGPNTSGK
ncbi:hypothetical protein F5Y15DRAFT_411492 [Xylariaceae sp. FL0016]|nr:hypothetical protein F5Y15DRAFT_411492 [Xylariaceae sp. FL0016]